MGTIHAKGVVDFLIRDVIRVEGIIKDYIGSRFSGEAKL